MRYQTTHDTIYVANVSLNSYYNFSISK